MKRIFLIEFSVFILFFFLLGGALHADTRPTFTTAGVVQVGLHSVKLFGNFDSHGVSSFEENPPVVWFEYGENRDHLDKKTSESLRPAGNYLFTQYVPGFTIGKNYYMRTAIRFNGYIERGVIVPFQLRKDVKNYIGGDKILSHDSYISGYSVGSLTRTSQREDRTRIEFNDDGSRRKERVSSRNIYSFADFWKELKAFFIGHEEGNKRKETSIPKENGKILTEEKDSENKRVLSVGSNEVVNSSYDTKYRKYYNNNTNIKSQKLLTNTTGVKAHFVPILPFFLFLFVLTIFIILIYLFRKRRKFAHHERIVSSTRRKIPLAREEFSQRKLYRIEHEPIEQVRKRME